MKHFVLYSAAALFLATATAQGQTPITLTNTGYPTTGIDTLGLAGNFSSFANLGTPAANGSWDLSAATYASYVVRGQIAPPSTGNPFPGSSYYEPAHYSFAGGALSYNINDYRQLTGGGILTLGEEIPTRTAIPIGAVTGTGTDSLVFPQQVITHVPAEMMLKFPASLDTSWMTLNTKYATQFTLTVAALSLNQVPGERRSSLNTTDSVMGWGKMRVALKAGGNSVWIPVLQVRHSEEVTDSFYLGGAPAPAAVLGGFGLTQGQVTGQYQVLYYQASKGTPLAAMYYSDNTYGTPTELDVMSSGVTPSSVKTVGLISNVKIYPNPTHGQVQVEVPGNQFGGWQYALTNMSGQQVATGSLPLHAGAQAATINLPSGVTPGIYTVRIFCAEGAASATLLVE